MQSVTGERRRVRVRGIVQGVGFRPFVYGLALELGLAGWVLNDAAGVVADVQGRPSDVEAFCRRLTTDAPPTAVVEGGDWAPLEPQPRGGFVIAAATEGTGEGGALRGGCPPAPPRTAVVEGVDGAPREPQPGAGFVIAASPEGTGEPVAGTLPPPALPPCDACLAEIAAPADRRYRHPFVS